MTPALLEETFDRERVPLLASIESRCRAAVEGPSEGAIDRAIRAFESGEPLEPDLAREVMERITDGAEDEASIAAFLAHTAPQRLSGKTIAAFAAVMRDRAHRIAPRVEGPLVDTCGTGGDGFKTINVSTAAAFVLVSRGLAVAKHGNRGITSACGSADVLEHLGVAIDLEPAQVQDVIERAGIGFLFAPRFHPAMRHVQGVRKRLASEGAIAGLTLKTVFNVLGPLTNPARATHQIVGVYAADLVAPVAEALALLGTRAMVVHGLGPGGEPMDEISPFGPTHAAVVESAGTVTERILSPEDLGVLPVEVAAVAASPTVAENATRIREVLAGRSDDARELVALNAGAALWITGRAADIPSGVADARSELRSGRPAQCLDRLIDVSARNAA